MIYNDSDTADKAVRSESNFILIYLTCKVVIESINVRRHLLIYIFF
jgi:hypothetical protein